MNIQDINIKLIKENAITPTYGSTFAAGADLYAAIDEKITIKPGETAFIGTGIDSDYRGELIVALHNHSQELHEINPNDRIAQIVFTPYLKGNFQVVDDLTDTTRGTGGFGSTDKENK